jgi:hypothetical protein
VTPLQNALQSQSTGRKWRQNAKALKMFSNQQHSASFAGFLHHILQALQSHVCNNLQQVAVLLTVRMEGKSRPLMLILAVERLACVAS